MRSGGEAHALHCHFEGAFAGCVERALLTDQSRWHARIGATADALNVPRSVYALAHVGGSLRHFARAQFFVRNGGHFDLDIDAVD